MEVFSFTTIIAAGESASTWVVRFNRWLETSATVEDLQLSPLLSLTLPCVALENSLFNLVFETNVASVKLWRSLGFVNSGRVPRAGRLKGIDRLVDALQFFCNLDEVKHETIDI
jgi:hypothetical protein